MKISTHPVIGGLKPTLPAQIKIWEAAQDIYKNYPVLLDAAKQTIFGE
jgi:hypothetical protein